MKSTVCICVFELSLGVFWSSLPQFWFWWGIFLRLCAEKVRLI